MASEAYRGWHVESWGDIRRGDEVADSVLGTRFRVLDIYMTRFDCTAWVVNLNDGPASKCGQEHEYPCKHLSK